MTHVTRARITGILAACLLLLSSLGAGLALGAPQPFEPYRANCPGYGETLITSPGMGAYTPSFIEGTHQVLLTYIVSFTVSVGGQTSNGYSERAAPLPADSITCDFVYRTHVNGVLLVLTGWLTGPIVGQP